MLAHVRPIIARFLLPSFPIFLSAQNERKISHHNSARWKKLTVLSKDNNATRQKSEMGEVIRVAKCFETLQLQLFSHISGTPGHNHCKLLMLVIILVIVEGISEGAKPGAKPNSGSIFIYASHYRDDGRSPKNF